MKKFLLGLIAGVVLFLPATAVAELVDKDYKWPNIIYEFASGCSDNTTATTNDSCGRVAVFDDKDNKCYVAYSVDHPQPSISCVKR